MKFSLLIGWRYIFSKDNDGFVSFISRTSIIGLTLGIAVLIIVLSVMNGFSKELQDKILGFIPHAIITPNTPQKDWQKYQNDIFTKLENSEYKNKIKIEAIAPFTSVEGMLVGSNHSEFTIISGINPQEEAKVSNITRFMVSGEIENLSKIKFGIILGEILARKLGVFNGDKINLVTSNLDISIAGIFPRIKSFTVVGIFSAKSEIDAKYALINIKDAAVIKGMSRNEVSSFRIKYTDIFSAPINTYFLSEIMGENVGFQDWTDTYGNLFSSIKMEKKMVGLLLFLIILTAIFNVLSTLVILVKDKASQIAILRTMGASSMQIVNIFVFQGVIIAVIGGVLGITIGILIASFINEIVSSIEYVFSVAFLSSDTYFISYFPSSIIVEDVVTTGLVSFVLCILATIYPAIRASKITPAHTLRDE
jgi:lipoprotein-releasing system permease protein